MKTEPNKLGLEEFNALSEFGKWSKKDSGDFQVTVSAFFWKIIVESDQYKSDLIENCTSKFADMVKIWAVSKKKPFFI